MEATTFSAHEQLAAALSAHLCKKAFNHYRPRKASTPFSSRSTPVDSRSQRMRRLKRS
jgi:hypothetical protein